MDEASRRIGNEPLICAGLASAAAAVSLLGFGSTSAWPLESALSLLCAAAGLALNALGKRRWSAWLGAIVLGIGLLNLLGHTLSQPLGLSPLLSLPGAATMPPHTALAAIACGVALLLAAPGRTERVRSVGVGALGGGVISLALASLAAHSLDLEGAYAWGLLIRMPISIAVGLVLLSVGIVSLAWRENAADRRRYGMGISFSIVSGLTVSVALSGSLLREEGRAQQRLASSELGRLAYALGIVTDVHAIGIERMADRWNREEGTPFWRWKADAENHLAQVSAFRALAWIDTGGDPHWARGDQTTRLLSADQAQAALAAAATQPSALFLESTPEPSAITAVARLREGGALVAILSIDALLELSWGEGTPGHSIVLENTSGLLFASSPEPVSPDAAGEQVDFRLRGLDWRLRVAPLDATAVGAAPLLTFSGGLFLTLLASFAMALRRTALERAEALEVVSRELEASAAQLQHTNTELLRSNEELARFATLASHDLQEPLRQITSFSERLEDKHSASLDDNGRTYLGFISEAATRARSLIEDLLRYARVDGQAMKLEIVDCDSALDAALENLHGRIEDTGADIDRDSLPSVRANPSLMAQLFQNLVGNALKYRSTAKPLIHVGVRSAGESWEFSVRDNGIGIDPAYHAKIFQIFERVTPSGEDQNDPRGTGVGLAVCKKVVERLGGEIALESAPGEGSTFRFTIPKLKGAAGIPERVVG